MKKKNIDALWAHVHWLGVLQATGSYTAAATRLGVSKAAVSKRIAELELAAGVPLVGRSTRSVRLTEAGLDLVASTTDAFTQIDHAFAGVRDRATRPSGVLRLTAPVALGRQQIVTRLPQFLERYPDIRVELDLSDRLVSLAQDGFDLAIRHVAAVPETHIAWVLCTTETLLAASPAYLRAHAAPVRPADLAEHACLHYLRGPATPTWSFVPTRGAAARETVQIKGPFAANNSEALRELALAGAGIAMLPDFSADDAIRAGRLVKVLPRWKPTGAFGEHIFAMRPYSPHVPRAVSAFVAHFRAALKKRPSAG